MKDIQIQRNIGMDLLEIPKVTDHHTFYLSSCESGAGGDERSSIISSRRSSTASSSSLSSSLNVGLPTPPGPVHTNIFLGVLKRLHCLTLRRKKHGRYRSLSSSLHLFFKKHHLNNDIDVPSSEFFKSSSSPAISTTTTTINIENHKNSHRDTSCFHLNLTGGNKHKDSHNERNNHKLRRSLLRRAQTSNNTVSEDNNTNTLSSLDLAITISVPKTNSNTSLTPTQNLTPIEVKRVSRRIFCFQRVCEKGVWVRVYCFCLSNIQCLDIHCISRSRQCQCCYYNYSSIVS
jgi:hypothetical protein